MDRKGLFSIGEVSKLFHISNFRFSGSFCSSPFQKNKSCGVQKSP